MSDRRPHSLLARRDFIRSAMAGTALSVLGGIAILGNPGDAESQRRPDGRPQLPPGQRPLSELRPMGGEQGSTDVRRFRLRVHGLVDAPYELDYRQLLREEQSDQTLDVHCVTGWSLLNGEFRGVTLRALADKAHVRSAARFVILEAAHGYTANIPLSTALDGKSMVSYRLNGRPFAPQHGAPVRAIIPDLYFWKSAKWIEAIRFSDRDELGYWEQRGYHRLGDPWREQRHTND